MKIKIEQIIIQIFVHDAGTANDEQTTSKIKARCPHCGWVRDYDTKIKAVRGLSGHMAHCEGDYDPPPHGQKVQAMIDEFFNS